MRQIWSYSLLFYLYYLEVCAFRHNAPFQHQTAKHYCRDVALIEAPLMPRGASFSNILFIRAGNPAGKCVTF